MAQSINALSTEYLRYLIQATLAGAPYNPTTDTVQFAFVAVGTEPTTWVTGSWETIGAQYYARVLVGPTGGAYTGTAAATVNLYCKITDNPEIPVRLVDTITFT